MLNGRNRMGSEGAGGAGVTDERERERRPERPDMLVTFLLYYSRSSQMINLGCAIYR